LYADPDERLIICCRLKYGFVLSLAYSQLTSYFWEKHDVPNNLRKRLTYYLKHAYPYEFCDLVIALTRLDSSPIHLKLREYKGHNCRKCGH
ncbi:hypothetical protein DL95DRAFT_316829, partial [Leptodontidium sp. 2 PMI_412]